MMTNKDGLGAWWTVLLLCPALVWSAGCVFDKSGHPYESQVWTCKVPVSECRYDFLPTGTQILDTGHRAEISSTPFVVGEVGPYFDLGAVFQSIETRPEARALNGAVLIQTSEAARHLTSADGYSFSVEVDDVVTSVWVFYDEQCGLPPTWLNGDSGPADDPYARVVLSSPGPGQGPGERATFRGWRLNEPELPPAPGETAVFHFFVNTGWGNSAHVDCAMYFVVVVPAADISQPCSPNVLTNEFIVEAPTWEDSVQAAQRALGVCTSSVEDYQTCPASTQDVLCEVSSEHTASVTQQLSLHMTDRSFRISSEGAFTPNPPASPQLRITANGSAGTANDLSGALYFDYDPLTGDAQIQEISLALDHMTAGGYEIRDLRIISLDRIQAVCKDNATKSAALCRDYTIPKGNAGFLIAADVDGDRMLFASQSTVDATFSVDVNSRTFAYSDSQTSNSLVVNGKTIPVDIELDLRGSFVNFSPITSISETDQTVECGYQVGSADGGFEWVDRGNQYPVNLDAWGTFDLESSVGLEYEWFDNYGTAIQHHLGSGDFVTVPAHAWSYGVHSLTLVVSEEWSSPNMPAGFGPVYRTASFHHFNMEVTDTTPPTIVAAPPDVTVSVAPTDRGVVVDIGEIKAEDGCSPTVTITNDAPSGNRFRPGSHTVTWVVDDNRGNVVTYEQYINVETERLPGKEPPLLEPIWRK